MVIEFPEKILKHPLYGLHVEVQATSLFIVYQILEMHLFLTFSPFADMCRLATECSDSVSKHEGQ